MTHVQLPLSDRHLSDLSSRLRVLGDPVRLRLLHRLAVSPCGVTELSRHVSSTQPNVSKHLKVLLTEGIVERAQIRNTAVYSLIDKRVDCVWRMLEIPEGE